MRILFSFLLVALSVSMCAFATPAYAEGAITGTDNLEATINVPLPITDVQITGRTGTIPVKLLVTSGTLAMSTTTGLTFTGPTTGSELYFSGTVANVNAALATLTYTRTNTGSDTLEVSLVEPGEVFFSGNGHLYEYISVPSGITWNAAQTAAAALTRYGSSGYLTTITSLNENNFVADRLEGAGWMGASDVASEGVWRWVTGPETGTNFWNGNGSGSVVTYANWNTGEPNDSGSNEDCAQFLSGGLNGKWNDLPCTGTTLTGYVVEFGAPGDLPETTGNEFTITTYNPLTVSSLSPTDNAQSINRAANLVITFSAAASAETGNITIRRTSDNSVITTIDVTSGQVTGSGTNTITINPSIVLPGNTSMYVQIASTAFDAVAGGSYAGISDTTSWSFTTLPASSITYTPITGAQLSVSDATMHCDGSATANVTITGIGATQYLLSEDPAFLTDTWQGLTNGTTSVNWTFSNTESPVTLFAALRNSSATVQYLQSTVTLASSCETPSEETPRTGPSPWNGTIELITDVSDMELIKGTNFDTVYLLEDGVRRPFIQESIYYTHYRNFDDVHVVTDATLSTIPLGMPVLPKEGTLVKITSKPEVFVVQPHNGQPSLHYIPDENAAAEEYGTDWASLVIDIDVTLFNKFSRE